MEFNLSLKTGEKKIQKKGLSSVKFWVNNIIADWGGFNWSDDQSNQGIINTAEQLPDLFMVIDYISQVVSNIPIKLETKAGKESKNPDLIKLVSDPNYYQNWKELIKQFTAYYELLGNSYLYAIIPDGMRTISSLHVLPAGQMGVVLQSDNKLPDWMNQVLAFKMTLGGVDYNIDAEMVLHKRNFSFRYENGSYIYGISKYIPGNKITTELKAIYDAKTSIISQRGALGILSNESDIPDREESELIKERLKEKFGLGVDQDKFIVTTQKLSWQQMSMGIGELQIIENARYSFDKICQLNGIDPVIFSTVGSTYANKEQAQKAFMKNVIKTKVDDIYSDFNQWIAPYFGGDRVIPDWSQVEEMQADLKTLTDIYVSQINSGIITPYKAYELIYKDINIQNPPKDEYKNINAGKLMTPIQGEQNNEQIEMIGTTNVANQGLNGAQIAGLIQILEQLSTGLINEESAKAIISASFPYMGQQMIASIVNGVNEQNSDEQNEVNRLQDMVNENQLQNGR